MGCEKAMSCIRLVRIIFIAVLAFYISSTARPGEWEDYLGSPYHDFRWDWLVRDGHAAYGKGNYKEALSIYQEAMKKRK